MYTDLLTDKSPSDRHHYIDFLRVFAILLMFLYHVSMIFVAEWNWHIKNDERSNVLMEANYGWLSSACRYCFLFLGLSPAYYSID